MDKINRNKLKINSLINNKIKYLGKTYLNEEINQEIIIDILHYSNIDESIFEDKIEGYFGLDIDSGFFDEHLKDIKKNLLEIKKLLE